MAEGVIVNVVLILIGSEGGSGCFGENFHSY